MATKAKKAETKAADEKATNVPGKTVGRKSGLGVTKTWNLYLAANFKAHLDDEQLVAKMHEEFPEREYFQPTSRVRGWYNAGRFGFGLGPDVRLEGDKRSTPYKGGQPMKRGTAGLEKANAARAARAAKKETKDAKAGKKAAARKAVTVVKRRRAAATPAAE